jgi:P4 family phage/plasmid primase-like protien
MVQNEYEFYSDPDYLAEGFLQSNFLWDRGGEDIPGVGGWSLRYWRGDFYGWDGLRYVKVCENEMRLWVKRYLHKLNVFARQPGEQAQRIRISSQLINNIVLCIAGTEGVHLPAVRGPNSWDDKRGVALPATLSFVNGLLICFRQQPLLIDHEPGYFCLTHLPYAYDDQAECPDWLAFLDQVTEGDSERIELLQQWAGYLLKQSTSEQKFLLIAGEGGNGKTVFTTILEKMVGEDNVSHVPLCQFGNRFSLSATLGKMLNSSSESSHGVDELAETMLKSYTSGDRMTFERKYREPIHARPTAKVMISTNQLPQFIDKSQGIWRRMLFVPFERTIAEDQQNPDLIEQLSYELPGIFNWAYKGLQSLGQSGRFVKPAKCRAATAQYRRDVNPARSFLLDNYVAGLEYEGLPCKELYESYVTWCHENGHRQMNSSNFGKEVKRAFPGVRKDQRQCGRLRTCFYAGLAVIEGSQITADRSGCMPAASYVL